VDRDRFKTIAFKIGNEDKAKFMDLALEIEEKYGKIKYFKS